MYFSSLVKQELSRILPQDDAEQRGELLAFTMLRGTLRSSESDKTLILMLENPMMIKVVYFLFKKAFGIEVAIDTVKKGHKKKFYLVTVPDSQKTGSILQNLLLKTDSHGKLHLGYPIFDEKGFLSGDFSPRAFIRGVFLTEGFVNDPERMYHLEISCSTRHEAKVIRDILQASSFSVKISLWQKRWAVYMKKCEQIFEFLRFIGVQRALLNFQDIIARKDILNTVNRLVNCETANIDKTVLSASRQLFYIELVKQHAGPGILAPGLVEVMEARLDHPYASIRELASIIGNGISKSGVFHRLKKIEQLAEIYLAQENIS